MKIEMMGRAPLLAVLVTTLIAVPASGNVVGPFATKAVAELKDARGKVRGRAEINQSPDGLVLEVSVKGISAGLHGVHVHAVGKCEAPDFTTAGPHWNPSSHQHGHRNAKGAHLGDLPNIDVNRRLVGTLRAHLGTGTVVSQPPALLDSDGASLIVHADPDDERTDPTGNSGKRLLCGVFRAAR